MTSRVTLRSERRKPKIDYVKAFEIVEEIAGPRLLEKYYVDLRHWIHFNELRDRGENFEYIMSMTEMHDLAAMHLLEGFRKCLQKHDHDRKKVRECMEGKIDP